MALMKVLTTLYLLLVYCKGDIADYYTAAVVEYATPYTPSLSADEVMIRNAAKYAEFMKNASLKQVDIIVFPEDGLFHNNARTAVEVPNPKAEIVPCDKNATFHQALVIVSCASRSQGLYTVINLKEVYFNSSTNETLWYNTNVAFDRNGTVIGRYRKYNPYGELVNKTATPEYSVFKTDFNVQFGMFTCFDIDFKEPALVLAEDLGVRHFVFPNCWSSELPFLTAIQTQWGWAFSLDVVLLASGCNDPSEGGSGSGIYMRNKGIQTYTQTNSHASKMLIARIPLMSNSSGNHTPPTLSTVTTNTTPVNINTDYETTIASGSSNKSSTSLAMLRDYLDVYQTKLVIDPAEVTALNTTFTNASTINLTLTTEVTLCQNDFCCYFQVDVIDSFSTSPPEQLDRGDDFSSYVYRLAVFDGVRSYGGGVATGGVQVCGIIPCLNNSVASCGLRADSSNYSPKYSLGNLYKVGTTFTRIEISAEFFYNNTFIFPSVLVTGENDEFGELLDQVLFEKYDPFNHTCLSNMKIQSTISNLITAAVYARQFDKDGEPRTELSSANHHNTSLNLLLLAFIILKIEIY